MEEIQVGEYVRTKDGRIIKFNKFRTLRVGCTNPKYYKTIISGRGHYKYDDIVKHSINIIDILKIGDFIHTDYGWGWYHHKVDEETIVIDDGDEFIDVKKDEIHKILTQEMLWNNSYELKE
jgi:hypothetical protein